MDKVREKRDFFTMSSMHIFLSQARQINIHTLGMFYDSDLFKTNKLVHI